MRNCVFVSATEMFQSLGDKKRTHSIIIEDDLVHDKQTILLIYRNSTHADYMGRTWDSLWDVLIDHDWVRGDDVHIMHTSWPPRLPEKDLNVYSDLLFESLRYHNGDNAQESCGKSSNHFKLVFVYKNEEDRKRIEKSLCKYEK